jgi:hypothetical protein
MQQIMHFSLYCVCYNFLCILNLSGSEQGDASGGKCNSESKGAESDICTQTKEEEEVEVPKESVDFKVIYNKNKYDVNFLLDSTVGQLKQHLQDIIGNCISFYYSCK